MCGFPQLYMHNLKSQPMKNIFNIFIFFFRNIKKCVRYIRDETKEKTWQWVDNDLFLI